MKLHLLGPLKNRNDRFPYPLFNSSNPNLSPLGRILSPRPECECLKVMKNSLTHPCRSSTFLILERGSGCYRFCNSWTSLLHRGYWYLVHELQVAVRLLFKTHRFPWLDWAVRLLVIGLWREPLNNYLVRRAVDNFFELPASFLVLLFDVFSCNLFQTYCCRRDIAYFMRIVSLYTCLTSLYPLRLENQRRRSAQSDRSRRR